MIKLFHRDFDNEFYQTVATLDKLDQDPTLTQRQVDQLIAQAKQVAFQEGYESGSISGQNDAVSEFDNELKVSISALNDQIEEMQLNVGAYHDQLEAHTLMFVQSALKQILPGLKTSYASDCAVHIVQQCLDMTSSVPSLKICVSPETKKQLILQGVVSAGPAIEIHIEDDKSKSDGEAWVGWDGGWAEYSLDDVCDQILNGIQSALTNSKINKE